MTYSCATASWCQKDGAGVTAPRAGGSRIPAFLAWSKAGRDWFRAEMPHGTVIELTDAGHYVFVTQPDRVEREMRAFLARTP